MKFVSIRSLTCVLFLLAGLSFAAPSVAADATTPPGSTPAACSLVDDAAVNASSVPSVPNQDAPKVLKFTGIPNQKTTELNEKYKPLAAYLTTKLGIPVEYVPSVDYNASVDAFKNGDVQLAWFGGYTGVQARTAVDGARAIACGARDVKFKSYFIANTGAGLEASAEFPMSFEKKKFTFGSASSTSGRLMPEYFIRKLAKKSPKEFFGAEPSFSGGHDKTMELVAAGTFDCGVVDYTVYDKKVKEWTEKKAKGEQVPDASKLTVIWTTPEYADYQFTAHPSLDKTFGAGFTEKLQGVLIAIQGDDRKVLAGLDRESDGLIKCTNETFDDLRKTAIEIGLVR